MRRVSAAALLGLLVACSGSSRTVPLEILGTWRSSSATHADRYLELRDRAVIFGTGKYTMEMRAVEWARSDDAEPPERGREHRVAYRNDQGEILDLRLLHDVGPPETLRFVNHKDVWTREKPAVAPSPERKR
jgi:hypothetical protein